MCEIARSSPSYLEADRVEIEIVVALLGGVGGLGQRRAERRAVAEQLERLCLPAC